MSEDEMKKKEDEEKKKRQKLDVLVTTFIEVEIYASAYFSEHLFHLTNTHTFRFNTHD
jgi:hypothetical protein